MSEKQITIDYKNLCENYSKEVGCYNTFDGSCIKEQCFTYRLLELLKAKEQECEELKKELMKKDEANTFFNTPIEGWSNDPCEICKCKQTLTEIKEIAKNSCCLQPTSTCEEYENCNECSKKSDDETVKQIIKKISEVKYAR